MYEIVAWNKKKKKMKRRQQQQQSKECDYFAQFCMLLLLQLPMVQVCYACLAYCALICSFPANLFDDDDDDFTRIVRSLQRQFLPRFLFLFRFLFLSSIHLHSCLTSVCSLFLSFFLTSILRFYLYRRCWTFCLSVCLSIRWQTTVKASGKWGHCYLQSNSRFLFYLSFWSQDPKSLHHETNN